MAQLARTTDSKISVDQSKIKANKSKEFFYQQKRESDTQIMVDAHWDKAIKDPQNAQFYFRDHPQEYTTL